jgi:protein-tyrosine phosphatase
MSLILKNLFLGSIFEAYEPWFLTTNKIDLVVNAAQEINIDYDKIGFPNIKTIRLDYLDLPNEDLNKDNKLDNVIEKIDESLKNNKPVLVHCRAGVSRSASVVIAYLMKKYNLSFLDASNFILSKRPFISPNPGYINQLKNIK